MLQDIKKIFNLILKEYILAAVVLFIIMSILYQLNKVNLNLPLGGNGDGLLSVVMIKAAVSGSWSNLFFFHVAKLTSKNYSKSIFIF